MGKEKLTYTIELTYEQLEEMIEFYKNKIKEMERKMDDLMGEIDE